MQDLILSNKGILQSRPIVIIVVLLCLVHVLPVCAEENEITLDQAREYFLRHNFDILINQYEVRKAEADLQGAKLFPNPAVSVNYTGLDPSTFRANENTQHIYRVDQLVELGGKRGLRTGAASESLESTKLSHKDAVRVLLTGFYTQFFNMSLDLLNVKLAKEELEQSEKILEIAEKRYNAGFLSSVDYTKLKVAQVDMESSLISLENQYKNDSEQFRLLIGSPKVVIPSQGQIRDSFQEYGEEDLINKAYQKRTDLQAFQRQLTSEEYSVSLAKAAAIPDMTIGASMRTSARNNGRV